MTKKYLANLISTLFGVLFLSLLTYLRIICFQENEVSWYFLLSLAVFISPPIRSSINEQKNLYSILFYVLYSLFYIIGIVGISGAIVHFYVYHGGTGLETTYNIWNIPALIYTLVGFLFYLSSFFFTKEKITGKSYLLFYIILMMIEAANQVRSMGILQNIFTISILSFMNISLIASVVLIFLGLHLFLRRKSLTSHASFYVMGLLLIICSVLTLNVAGFFLGMQIFHSSNSLGIKDI